VIICSVRVAELFELTGKTAIVTGGGSGLGRQFAAGLADAGANLLLCARNVERCQETAAALREEYGVTVLAEGCDVRDADRVQEVVALAQGELGPIDVLVNNAGTSWGAPAEDYPLDGWRKVIDVNLTGTFLFAQAVGRGMLERGEGSIINVASVAAFGGAPAELMDAIGYNASKGGVVALTLDLAVKWARRGVRVNAIAPGWFPSDMSDVLLKRWEKEFIARIPLGRFGGDDDLKGAVVFLSSRAASFVTGHILLVDGGQSAT
jgi:NAD(P)-dependent dehydrogenase (short-subunit alcohol dehydrogenase family)